MIALEASGRKRGTAVTALCLALAGVYLAVLLIPFTRTFFALSSPTLAIGLIAAGGCVVSILGLALTSDSFVVGRPRRL